MTNPRHVQQLDARNTITREEADRLRAAWETQAAEPIKILDEWQPGIVSDLLDLVRQYRNDMMFPDLDDDQRRRRIEAIDAVIAKAEGRVG